MSADKIRSIARSNEAIAAKHTPWDRFSDLPNMKAMMVLSCMDPRANPTDFWDTGAIPIIRNIGGSPTEDALKCIRFIAGVMSNGRNTVGAVAVVHHTDCGIEHFSDEEVRAGVKKQVGLEGERAKEMDEMGFGCAKGTSHGLEEGVWKDMRIIKNDPYLPKDLEVVGYVYDVFSGKTTEVGQL